MRVPVRLLRCEWPPNDGVLPGDPRFDALLESIREEGIREPLTINLNWRVIDGAHRLSAARLLGIEAVEVRVWTETEFVSLPASTTGDDAASSNQRFDGGNTEPAVQVARLDVARLAQAMRFGVAWTGVPEPDEWVRIARLVAAEYARLAAAPSNKESDHD